MTKKKITVIGGGITGIWQGLTLAQKGHDITLLEKSAEPFAESASLLAGAMIAPFCEAETGGTLIQKLGVRSLEIWKSVCPEIGSAGSLVLTRPREKQELKRFARQTQGHREIAADEIASLEPDLDGLYDAALYFEQETHLKPKDTLPHLIEKFLGAGGKLELGVDGNQAITQDHPSDLVIDCTGLDAKEILKDLRGVRGERLLLRTTEITLHRAIHLLHPRFPIYVVPWPDNIYMVGATMIESSSKAPVSVRSALELLSAAFALHPAFAEAEILSFDVGIRPAFPDNLPKIIVGGGKLYVNGLYRNGYLLAPALAELVAGYIETGDCSSEVFVEDYFER